MCRQTITARFSVKSSRVQISLRVRTRAKWGKRIAWSWRGGINLNSLETGRHILSNLTRAVTQQTQDKMRRENKPKVKKLILNRRIWRDLKLSKTKRLKNKRKWKTKGKKLGSVKKSWKTWFLRRLKRTEPRRQRKRNRRKSRPWWICKKSRNSAQKLLWSQRKRKDKTS